MLANQNGQALNGLVEVAGRVFQVVYHRGAHTRVSCASRVALVLARAHVCVKDLHCRSPFSKFAPKSAIQLGWIPCLFTDRVAAYSSNCNIRAKRIRQPFAATEAGTDTFQCRLMTAMQRRKCMAPPQKVCWAIVSRSRPWWA